MNQNLKTSRSHARRGEHTTGELLRQAARDAIGGADIDLEIDVPADARCAVDPDRLVALVAAMVRGSIDCLPDGGEISLTLWHSESTFEIEVADNGPAIESRPRRLPPAAVSLGAEMLWQNCPQGGAAVTAKLRAANAVREAA